MNVMSSVKQKGSGVLEKRRLDHAVREVLFERGLWEVDTVFPRTTVLEALSVMEEKNVGALVVTEGEMLVGVISERDCARKVLLGGMDPGRIAVGKVMSREVCSVTANKRVSECIDLMLRRHIRHLPILFGRYLVGCLSLRNLLEYLSRAGGRTGTTEAGLPQRAGAKTPPLA